MHRDCTGGFIATHDRVRFGEEPGEGTVTGFDTEGGCVAVRWDGQDHDSWEDAGYLIVISGIRSGRIRCGRV
jgi:hypothetical protein